MRRVLDTLGWAAVVVAAGLVVSLVHGGWVPLVGVVFVLAAVGVPGLAFASRLFPGRDAVQRVAATVALGALLLLVVGSILVLTPFRLTPSLTVWSVAAGGAVLLAVARGVRPLPARRRMTRLPRPSAGTLVAGVVGALLLAAAVVVTVVSQRHAATERPATTLSATALAAPSASVTPGSSTGGAQRVRVTIVSHESAGRRFTLRIGSGGPADRAVSFDLRPGQRHTEVGSVEPGRPVECRLFRAPATDGTAYRVLRLGA